MLFLENANPINGWLSRAKEATFILSDPERTTRCARYSRCQDYSGKIPGSVDSSRKGINIRG